MSDGSGLLEDPSSAWDIWCERHPSTAPCSGECAYYRLCDCGEHYYCLANDEFYDIDDEGEECPSFEAKR